MGSQHHGLVQRATALAVTSLFALATPGCGGDDNGSTTTSGGTATKPATTGKTSKQATVLNLEADPNGALQFDKKTLEARAGEVTIDMKNPSSVEHDVVIEGNGVEKGGPTVSNGGTSKATANLKPGKYTFYCSVDGHKQAGMEGTLTVK